MNDSQPETIPTAEADSPDQPGIGAKALALAGFAETALCDDPTGHGGIFTYTFTFAVAG